MVRFVVRAMLLKKECGANLAKRYESRRNSRPDRFKKTHNPANSNQFSANYMRIRAIPEREPTRRSILSEIEVAMFEDQARSLLSISLCYVTTYKTSSAIRLPPPFSAQTQGGWDMDRRCQWNSIRHWTLSCNALDDDRLCRWQSMGMNPPA
jgi:hypothetical protein